LQYKINSDSIFIQGKSHTVCEDYAINGEFDGIPYIIVCDGCSSSDNSDFGARILAQTFKANLHRVIQRIPIPTGSPFTNNSFRLDLKVLSDFIKYETAFLANDIVNSLKLNQNCLDATLMVAFVKNEYLYYFIYGDGMVLCEIDDQKISTTINYESGAPYYLNYLNNPNRKEQYEKQFNKPLRVTNLHAMKIEELECYEQIFSYMEISKLKKFVLSTDGMESWYSPADPSFIGFDERNLLNFKNSKGEFVKRRVNKMKRIYENQGLFHYDDLGIAGFNIEKIGDDEQGEINEKS